MASSSSAAGPAAAATPGPPLFGADSATPTATAESAARWRLSADQLANVPSLKAGMPGAEYEAAKQKGVNFIARHASRAVRAKRGTPEHDREAAAAERVVSIGLIAFQRFFSRRSVQAHDPLTMGAACLFLAFKLEETLRRSAADVAIDVLRSRSPELFSPHMPLDPKSEPVAAEEERIVQAERALLGATEYDLEYDYALPAPYLHGPARALGLPQDLETLAVRLAAEALRTTMPLEYDASAIGHAAVWGAMWVGREQGLPLGPDKVPNLFVALNTPLDVMEAIRTRAFASLSARQGLAASGMGIVPPAAATSAGAGAGSSAGAAASSGARGGAAPPTAYGGLPAVSSASGLGAPPAAIAGLLRAGSSGGGGDYATHAP